MDDARMQRAGVFVSTILGTASLAFSAAEYLQSSGGSTPAPSTSPSTPPASSLAPSISPFPDHPSPTLSPEKPYPCPRPSTSPSIIATSFPSGNGVYTHEAGNAAPGFLFAAGFFLTLSLLLGCTKSRVAHRPQQPSNV